jgi:hypothetical protein
MADNIKIGLVLTQPQFIYIKSEAERQGISQAELIRRMLGEARAGFNAPEHRIVGRLPRSRG